MNSTIHLSPTFLSCQSLSYVYCWTISSIKVSNFLLCAETVLHAGWCCLAQLGLNMEGSQCIGPSAPQWLRSYFSAESVSFFPDKTTCGKDLPQIWCAACPCVFWCNTSTCTWLPAPQVSPSGAASVAHSHRDVCLQQQTVPTKYLNAVKNDKVM